MSAPAAPPRPELRIGNIRIRGWGAAAFQLVVFGGIAALLWWQRPSPGMWVSGGIWVGFMLYWGAQARAPVPTVKAESRTSARRHNLLREIGLLLLFIPVPWLNWSLLPTGRWHVAAGLAVQVAGALFYLRAKRELGRQWSSAISIKTDHQLVTTGPYRYIRHPMYTGMITMALGTALVSTRVHALIGVAFVAWSYVVKIAIEEVWMHEQFAAQHDAWRRTSWKLLPPLY